MNRLLVWAGVAVAVLLLLWRIDHLANDRETLVRERDQLSARAASLQNTLRLQRELTSTAEALDRKHAEELTNANAELEELRRRVGTGSQRLLVKADCPDTRVSATAGAAGVDDGATAELTPAARQDYFALRGQLIRTEAALAGLQEYVSRVCLHGEG